MTSPPGSKVSFWSFNLIVCSVRVFRMNGRVGWAMVTPALSALGARVSEMSLSARSVILASARSPFQPLRTNRRFPTSSFRVIASRAFGDARVTARAGVLAVWPEAPVGTISDARRPTRTTGPRNREFMRLAAMDRAVIIHSRRPNAREIHPRLRSAASEQVRPGRPGVGRCSSSVQPHINPSAGHPRPAVWPRFAARPRSPVRRNGRSAAGLFGCAIPPSPAHGAAGLGGRPG